MTRAAVFAAVSLVCAVRAGAQPAQSVAAGSPLERRLTLHARDIALRDALDRVALLTRVRLSYSGDNLPLERRVTVNRDSAALGDVLADLVRAFGVQPVAIAADHVVLAPRSSAALDTVMRVVPMLERVVVTGSVIAASERPLPIALDVVPGRAMEQRDESNLSRVFSGSVPGVWLWEQTPTTMLARYGSIRGASSFGLSFPKVYIDGVEVANPLLLTQISPELVERVEIIRGPQGAALYGSDAISGVVNIVSRHEGTAPDGTNLQVRSSVGSSATQYGGSAVPVQEHALSVRAGSNLRSAGVSIGGSSSGQYIPQAYSRELRAVGDLRLIGSRMTLTTHARGHAKNAGVPVNPLLAGLANRDIDSDDDPQQLRMFGGGATLTVVPSDLWTYTMTAGLDGYRLSNVSNEHGPVPSVADTALRAASGSATRATLRASALTHAGSPERIGASFTVGAEQSVLWDRTLGADRSGSGSDSDSDDDVQEGRSSSSGILAQSTVTLANTVFLTGGLRQERIAQSSGRTQFATLPMAGVSIVRDFRAASVKWRGAYGKGIRAPRSSMHAAAREPRRTVHNPQLAPEQQAGVEAGMDVRLSRILGVSVTGFDQRVSGLIQTVTVTNPQAGNSGPSRSSWYQLQNVGEITNRGWEGQATLALGALSLGGAATLVDSRVQRLAPGYTGDMRAGDRTLAVPARTLSGTASWTRRTYQLSATVSRASDWINYDRLKIARALIADSLDADDLTGPKLRSFWASYPGTTRLRATASRDLWRGMTLTVSGENLLGYQRGEPDTITIVPGRTVSVGVRARF